ncbi:hypothetical protein V6N13_026284 [Hibiscus sabdariffa]
MSLLSLNCSNLLSVDFRNPATTLLTSKGKWRITIGSKINKTGIALVYDTDFINYGMLDGLLYAVPATGMWECVDFFLVSKTENSGLETSVDGPGAKHVVKASFDNNRMIPMPLVLIKIRMVHRFRNPDQPQIDVGVGLRYDYGYSMLPRHSMIKTRREECCGVGSVNLIAKLQM